MCQGDCQPQSDAIVFGSMRLRLRLLTLAALLSATIASAAEDRATPPCGGTFAGTWRTSYGVIRFRTEGNRVWGEHPNGYIRGWIKDDVLDADWVETTDFGQGIGSLRFVLGPGRREFNGTWRRLSGIGISAGQWNGKCIAPR